jgi:hypothetical protein
MAFFRRRHTVVLQVKRVLIGGALALTLAVSGGIAVAEANGKAPVETILAAAHVQAKAPLKLAALKLAKTRTVGGTKTYGVVKLTGKAPKGGALVKLAARSVQYIKVPSTVKVLAGHTTAKFVIKTAKIPRVGTGVVAAKYGGKLLKRPLTLTPNTSKRLANLVLVTGTTVGGSGEILGTVTLAKPAPAGGATIKLASSNAHAKFVYPTAVVAAGTTTGTFDIATTATNAVVVAKIAVSYGGQTLTRSLRVTPTPETLPLVTHLNVHADYCVPGTQYEGNLDINQFAPAGGVKVTLKSSRPDIIADQALVILEGQGTVRYYFTPAAVAAATTVTLSADLNGKHVEFARVVRPA